MKAIYSTLLLALLFHSAYPQGPDKNYLLGKFNPQTDSRFVKVGDEYAAGSGRGAFLRKETYQAFVKMANAARRDGVKLLIISATRNFEIQRGIWENKWSGRTLVEGKDLTTVKDPATRARIILRFSAMPGSSRHHWGTDLDLNSFVNSYFGSGVGLKTYEWLQKHAGEFGFCQPYTSRTAGRTGYEEEKWHWSYLPLAKPFLEDYVKLIEYRDINGFSGNETAEAIEIIEKYVQGVACK